MFANAVHPAHLDFSGGVGNNIIALAQRNISCVYFGIGLVEYAFAEFRVKYLGLQNLVKFIRPH